MISVRPASGLNFLFVCTRPVSRVRDSYAPAACAQGELVTVAAADASKEGATGTLLGNGAKVRNVMF